MNAFFANPKLKSSLVKIIAGIGILAIFVLIGGLSQITFAPGKPLPDGGTQNVFPVSAIGRVSWISSVCLSALAVLVPLGVIMVIFSAEARDLFKRNMKAVLFLLSILILIRILGSQEEGYIQAEIEQPGALPEVVEGPETALDLVEGNQASFTPPDLPQWQGYAAGFAVVVALGLLIFWIWETNRPPEEDYSHIALKTLRDLASGREWQDAVIQCYQQMSQTVQQQRGLNRAVSLTAGEFAQELIRAGLPETPVKALTRLFERARYSRGHSHDADRAEAIACLTQISQALEPEA